MKRSKTLAVKSRVVKRIKETQNDYRWWRYVNEEPASGYVEDAYEYTVPAYPELQRTPIERTRRPYRLSRTRIRTRLSRLGYRGAELSELVKNVGDPSLVASYSAATYCGWTKTDAIETFGRRVARELRRGVSPHIVILDEFQYYAAPAMTKWFQECRAFASSRRANSESAAEHADNDESENEAQLRAEDSSDEDAA